LLGAWHPPSLQAVDPRCSSATPAAQPPSLLLGPHFRIDRVTPAGTDPNTLYVYVSGLLNGPYELRYRGQLAFFTADAAGRVQPLANAAGFSARQPSANSWATPAAISR
jgi:hypothetical protein